MSSPKTPKKPRIINLEPDKKEKSKKLYFACEVVEYHLLEYLRSGTTDSKLRDLVMTYSESLIKQLIQKQGLAKIFISGDLEELFNVAFAQVERTLYKLKTTVHCRKCFNYNNPTESILYTPHKYEYNSMIEPKEIVEHIKKCPKCGTKLEADTLVLPEQGLYSGTETIIFRGTSKIFNLWSQVVRTVCLAYIKKSSRDYRNCEKYASHVFDKKIFADNEQYVDLIKKVKERAWYCEKTMALCDCLIDIPSSENPNKNVKRKISQKSGLSAKEVDMYMMVVKAIISLHCDDFNEESFEYVKEEYI